MKKALRMKILIIVMLFSAFYLAYSTYTGTPEYSLEQARRAFERHDAGSFQKYVDLERLAGNIYEQTLTAGGEEKRGYSREVPEEPTAIALVAFVKPQIVETATREVAGYIQTRRIDTEDGSSADGMSFSLAETWLEYCGNETAFSGIEYINKQGSLAHAGLKLSRVNDAPFILDLVMERRGNHWCITEVSNFSQYTGRDFEMEAGRVAKRDMLIAEAMQQALVLKGIEKTTMTGGFGLPESVIFDMEFTNRGKVEIDEYAVEIICASSKGEELGRFTIDSMEDIRPGETAKESMLKYINMHIRGDRGLYETAQSDMHIASRVRHVRFAERKPLSLASLK